VTLSIDREDLVDRRLPLAGTFNLREVRGYVARGGRTVRPGLLYRSDGLHRLGAEGRAGLRRLGLRTVIDLREGSEREADPDCLEGVQAIVVEQPIMCLTGDEEEIVDPEVPPGSLVSLQQLYAWLIADRGPELTAAIGHLARPGGLPALVHCAFGKDRTGIVIALLLSALGVDDETIAADYAVSELLLADGASPDPSDDGPSEPPLLVSDPSLAHHILSQARRVDGSVPAYLRRHGLSEAELATLESALLTPAPIDAPGSSRPPA
jgi:protein-tyrosine phosphatase